MNRRLMDCKTQLINQLVYFDDEKAKFLKPYFDDKSKERADLDRLLTSYCKELEHIVSDFNETTIHSTVLIGSQVKLRYEDDGSCETYTVVFPNEAQPELNRISFLSPIGRKLLLSKVMQSHELDLPLGVTKINIEDIEYGG
ncbi:GreA/GreB family elongation factor [Paenibacillus sp. N4]|uniref:GreA/GreB family elongation factor n=1 Tax=Paenibacillus vietnamensis TaxID=2590547 RepID=UPI001CD06372|nr:GreA/GreB family elongation factor [Paenibacillus vietnamensis]MCA0755146.1 GreA/GreB family elongation factor [Paenibacillus vietnamensis]